MPIAPKIKGPGGDDPPEPQEETDTTIIPHIQPSTQNNFSAEIPRWKELGIVTDSSPSEVADLEEVPVEDDNLTKEDWLYMKSIYNRLQDLGEEEMTDTQFRSRLCRPLQENKALRYLMLRRWKAAEFIEIEGIDGTGERLRIVFWFVKEPIVPEGFKEDPMPMEVWKKKFRKTAKGESAHWDDNRWVTIMSYEDGTKWKNCTNHKGQGRNGGVWSDRFFDSRNEAVEDGYYRIQKV